MSIPDKDNSISLQYLELILSSIESDLLNEEWSIDLSLKMYHFRGLAMITRNEISKDAGVSGLDVAFRQVYTRYLELASQLPGKDDI